MCKPVKTATCMRVLVAEEEDMVNAAGAVRQLIIIRPNADI